MNVIRSWNSAWSMTPSWFASASAKATRGSYVLPRSSPRAGAQASASPAARMSVLVCMVVSSGRLDLPGAVRLSARGSVGRLRLAPNDDRLLVLAAVLAVGELVGTRRSDRPGVARVGIVPHRRLSSLVVFERFLRGLARHPLVASVESVPDQAADQRP